jgi:hypothetical protein
MGNQMRREWGRGLMRDHPIRSYFRLAGVGAMLCTGLIEALNPHSATPPVELGAGIVSGMILAFAAKSLHIL